MYFLLREQGDSPPGTGFTDRLSLPSGAPLPRTQRRATVACRASCNHLLWLCHSRAVVRGGAVWKVGASSVQVSSVANGGKRESVSSCGQNWRIPREPDAEGVGSKWEMFWVGCTYVGKSRNEEVLELPCAGNARRQDKRVGQQTSVSSCRKYVWKIRVGMTKWKRTE